MEERWIAPGSKCDCCGRVKRDDEKCFVEEHATTGGSGFTFSWCPDCENNDEATAKVSEKHNRSPLEELKYDSSEMGVLLV